MELFSRSERHPIFDMPIINRSPHFITFILITLMVLALAILYHREIASRAFSNVGWHHLSEQVLEQEVASLTTFDMFNMAVELDRQNLRANLAAGIAHIESFNESDALTYWRQGQVDSTYVTQIGVQKNLKGYQDLALVYLRVASELAVSPSHESYFYAAGMCQRSRVTSAQLLEANQQYCGDLFRNNNNNLIFNGQFNHLIELGWTGTFSFVRNTTAEVSTDVHSGLPAPSLQTVGMSNSRHPGIYQRISMQPGTTIRMSGFYRTQSIENLDAWLLYVGWNQNGASQGSYAQSVKSDTDWTHIEREFTLPEGSEPWIQFYPVLLHGKGTVWSDNVELVQLSN